MQLYLGPLTCEPNFNQNYQRQSIACHHAMYNALKSSENTLNSQQPPPIKATQLSLIIIIITLIIIINLVSCLGSKNSQSYNIPSIIFIRPLSYKSSKDLLVA